MENYNPKKRDAQSPLSGDEDDLKRRFLEDNKPVFVSLDSIDEESDHCPPGSDLSVLLKQDEKNRPDVDSSMSIKVDSLIGRMDRFMNCFADLHATVTKNQNSNEKKFKHLESAHNELAVKVTNSVSVNRNRIELLESQLKDSMSANSALVNRISQLEGKQERILSDQSSINAKTSKDLKDLRIEQGITNRNVYDCFAETKERKMIISGVNEAPDEDTLSVALSCLNKVIDAAIAQKKPEDLGRLKRLSQPSLDKAFRLGKVGKNRRRNISLTFMRIADKDMVFSAKSEIKEQDGIKFYLNDDVSTDGRTLKAKLRRIVTVAKEQGIHTKLAGNKVIVGSRAYASNELELLPVCIKACLKQEKIIDDGIVYRGELSTLSNFHPAPFTLDGMAFAHVEQHFQYSKAIHHEENEIAQRILDLSNPLHIKALGDSIEENNTWLEKRMLLLYDGVRAKFEQNLFLQDELLSTHGKHLYEATTDSYYGCGIGFESNRWQKKDWVGENVAGLVLKKVRDELLGIDSDHDGPSMNNTLNEIASQDDVCSSSPMDNNDVTTTISDSQVDKRKQQAVNHSQTYSSSGNQPNAPAPSYLEYYNSYAHSPASTQRGRGRGKGRGKGRGRGRGRRSNTSQHNPPPSQRQTSMSSAERNFLGIKDKNTHKNKNPSLNKEPMNSSSPKSILNPLIWDSLTEDQRKGLLSLGLAPDSLAATGTVPNVPIKSKV